MVIASRKLENCQEAAKAITAETGRQTMAYGVHVGRWDELEPFVDAVYARFGKVDVLFNNAGMSPVYDKLTDVTEKLFDSVINLNFKGPFRLAALIGERMHAAGVRCDAMRHQTLQNRQHESSGLAGAGLRTGEQVASGEDRGDRLGLDRRRHGIAVFGDRANELSGQAEFCE